MTLTDGELWEFSSGPGGQGLQQLLAGGAAETSSP